MGFNGCCLVVVGVACKAKSLYFFGWFVQRSFSTKEAVVVEEGVSLGYWLNVIFL